MIMFQNTGTHPRVPLVNQLESRDEKWYRASTVLKVTSKITRASCRKRTGTIVPRAENVGDSITADHKVLGEGCESRNNHRYAVVVQDLATQWIRKTKTSQET